MVEVADAVVHLLRDQLVDEAGQLACPLIRFYATLPVRELDEPRRAFALAASPEATADTRCMTLLGSAGTRPAWNDVSRSSGHLAIPLETPDAMRALPMVSRLFEQMGLRPNEVVSPDPVQALELHHRSYDVFHVPDAKGSPWVPAQIDFVAPFGIRSVLGLGGALPSGALFAVLLFASAPIDHRCARMLQPLNLAIKAATVPFCYRVFPDVEGDAAVG